MFAFFEIFYIWQNVIYAWCISIGKLDPAVYDDDVLSIFDCHHISSNFFKPAESDDTDGIRSKGWNYVRSFLWSNGVVGLTSNILVTEATTFKIILACRIHLL